MENSLKLIKENIKKSVIGKDDIIDLMLVSLICSGHIIIEDLCSRRKNPILNYIKRCLRPLF